MHWIIAYFVCLASFLALDGLFIGTIGKKLYYKNLDGLINEKPRLFPGAQLYVMYMGAVLLYGVWPLLHFFESAPLGDNFFKIFLWGAGLGLLAFSTYSLTAQSLIKGWKYRVTYFDMAWGTFLTGVLTVIGYAIAR